MVGTELCIGEAWGLEWRDVHLEPVNGARFGYLLVRDGKTRNRRRYVLLNSAVHAMLEARAAEAKTPWGLHRFHVGETSTSQRPINSPGPPCSISTWRCPVLLNSRKTSSSTD